MATQWITAATAFSIVEQVAGSAEARFALCTRAHHGLLKSRADRFVVNGQSRESPLLDEAFWWARGHEALEQDWKLGEFSTWIDRKLHCEAFGVMFELHGVLALLPIELHPRIALSLSAAGNPAWVPAAQTRRHVYGPGGVSPMKADEVLIDQCRLGFVVGRAVLMQRCDRGRPPAWTAEEREWDVPVGSGQTSWMARVRRKIGTEACSPGAGRRRRGNAGSR